MSEEEQKAFRAHMREHELALKGWWYQEMLSTDAPLTERLTLFWHNHFTSSLQKVRWPAFLYQQNLLLRQHAVGNFRTFLHAIAKDPAMILYLDSQTNRKGAPNENFARELLELFTLGEGHYSEQDIKKIMGGNFLRVMREVERVARQIQAEQKISGGLSFEDIELMINNYMTAPHLIDQINEHGVSFELTPERRERLKTEFKDPQQAEQVLDAITKAKGNKSTKAHH